MGASICAEAEIRWRRAVDCAIINILAGSLRKGLSLRERLTDNHRKPIYTPLNNICRCLGRPDLDRRR